MDLTPCSGCDQCATRCTAGVPMTRDEYRAIREYVELALSREEIDRVVSQDKSLDLGEGAVFTMCRFRDMERNRCAVYPARPLICRLLGHVEWMPCPIEKVSRPVPTGDALALMQEYARHARKTFEEWQEDESPNR